MVYGILWRYVTTSAHQQTIQSIYVSSNKHTVNELKILWKFQLLNKGIKRKNVKNMTHGLWGLNFKAKDMS